MILWTATKRVMMMKPSTKILSALPDIDTLKNLCQSLATLDAIISRDWEGRYYSYNKAWGNGEECFTMRDGSGDEFLILFNESGAIINGFAHESVMSQWIVEPHTIWDRVIDDVPNDFKDFIHGEPVKSIGTTFCIWRRYTDAQWSIGNISFPEDEYSDGSADLLYILDNNPATYRDWAIEYYEEQFDCDPDNLKIKLVKSIYKHTPLTEELVSEINPDIDDLDELKNDLDEIGYNYTM